MLVNELMQIIFDYKRIVKETSCKKSMTSATLMV